MKWPRVLVGVATVAVVGFGAGAALQLATSTNSTAGVAGAASVRDCPDGSVIDSYTAGSRVYAIAQSESGDWIEVRDLTSPDQIVWVAAEDVELDADLSSLPISDCPANDGVVALGATTTTLDATTTTLDATTTTLDTTTTTVADTSTSTVADTTPTTPGGTTPTTVATTTTTPGGTTPTTAAPDTTPPTIGSKGATPDEIWEEDGLGVKCPLGTDRQSTISAVVTDNFAVTSVTAAWSDPDGIQNVPMSGVGSNYTTTFGPYEAGDWDPFSVFPYDHSVTITITARDAAGNKSSTTVSVTVWEIGHCLP